MVMDAIEKDVPVPTLTTALFTRFRSRQNTSFAEKMVAALRKAFGGTKRPTITGFLRGQHVTD